MGNRQALAPAHAAAHDRAKGQDANVDETGWKQGTAKAWLWVAVTATLTIVLIRPHRTRAAFDALAGPTPGVLTTDRYGVYTHRIGTRRQVCWAHLRRDFRAMIDRRNAGSEVGQALLTHADILFDHWQNGRDGTRTRPWFRRTHLGWLRAEVSARLTRGTACSCPETSGVCREILGVEESLWTFARRAGGRADEQRGRAGRASRRVRAEDECRDGQRAGQPVCRARARVDVRFS